MSPGTTEPHQIRSGFKRSLFHTKACTAFVFRMADDTKPVSISPQFCCDATWFPSSYGWQPSVLYSQHFGLPPLLDSRDLSWMENLFRKLGNSSWPGYTRSSRFMTLKVHRELSEGVSEVHVEQHKWTVSLDVNHFAPMELTVRTQSGFLVVEGKHEERQDDHGYISRCFVRKYKLPLEIDVETIHSCLTGDGILTVEAKLTLIPLPADVTIQVEAPTVEDKQEVGLQREETADGDGLPQAERDASQPPLPPGPAGKPEDASVAQQTDYEDRPRPTAPEIEGEQKPFPSRAAEGQQEEKPDGQRELMREEQQKLKQEEVLEGKAEDAGKPAEEAQEAAEQREAAQTSDTVPPQLEEKPGAVADGEVQGAVGDGEQPVSGQAQLEVQPQVLLKEKMQTKLQAK